MSADLPPEYLAPFKERCTAAKEAFFRAETPEEVERSFLDLSDVNYVVRSLSSLYRALEIAKEKISADSAYAKLAADLETVFNVLRLARDIEKVDRPWAQFGVDLEDKTYELLSQAPPRLPRDTTALEIPVPRRSTARGVEEIDPELEDLREMLGTKDRHVAETELSTFLPEVDRSAAAATIQTAFRSFSYGVRYSPSRFPLLSTFFTFSC
jgi:hypothetical protein